MLAKLILIICITGKVSLIVLTGTVDNEEAGYQSIQNVPAFRGLGCAQTRATHRYSRSLYGHISRWRRS